MEGSEDSTNITSDNKKDDLTFKPELYADILDVPFEVHQRQLERALSQYSNGKGVSSRVIQRKRTKKGGFGYHCDICEENEIYKAPHNVMLKFDQYSRLTHKDMENLLFQRISPIYETLGNIMKIVKAEQTLFEHFLKNLHPKFVQTKMNIPPGWFEYAERKHKSAVQQCYREKKQNYKVTTTHVLSVTVSSNIPKFLEKFGQIVAYGSTFKLKLPKLGQSIKSNIHSFELQKQDNRLPSQIRSLGKSVVAHSASVTPNTFCDTAQPSISQSQCIEHSETNEDVILNMECLQQKPEESDNELEIVPEEAPISDIPPEPSSEPNKTSSKKIEAETTSSSNLTEPGISETKVAPTENATLYKHVQVAVSQDLDVFMTNVPVNKLGRINNENLEHSDVIRFLQGLKIADVIVDVESLCNIFSSFPPHFKQPFLFHISVQVQEDKSKYFTVSSPLPHSEVTPECLKQEIVSEFLEKASSKKEIESADDANIQIMEYLNYCGSKLIDKETDCNDPRSELKDHIETMKFTSFLEWENLNSKSLPNMFYSLFSYGETNFLVHCKQPYQMKFGGQYDRALLYLKPHYCYEYGMEILTNTELAYLYFKAFLCDCAGAIIVHVDMKSYNIVKIEEKTLEMLENFPKMEALARLNSFFATLKMLNEGNFVYNHDAALPHSVVYEEFENVQYIQADLSLSTSKQLALSSLVLPTILHKTELTAWQRHNARVPLCFTPRKPGTYICHEYLSRDGRHCSKNNLCAFAHLTKNQLELEIGKEAYGKFIEKFDKPKEEGPHGVKKGKKSSFGKIKSGKGPKRPRNN